MALTVFYVDKIVKYVQALIAHNAESDLEGLLIILKAILAFNAPLPDVYNVILLHASVVQRVFM